MELFLLLLHFSWLLQIQEDWEATPPKQLVVHLKGRFDKKFHDKGPVEENFIIEKYLLTQDVV